jgi:hypothetical protein
MAWTTPRTWVAGELVTASMMNAHVRDNASALRATPANRCVAYHNTTQNVSAGNTDALNLNSEDVDTATMHDLVTNNNRVTIPAGGGGTYLVSGSSFVSNSNNGTCELQIRVNGTAVRRSSATTESGSDFGERTVVLPLTQLVLAAGDYVELAGSATSNTFTFGSATAALATRLEVIGPLPPT